MTVRDVAWLLVGWQSAILFRLVADYIFSVTDERKRRRARAARQADSA